MIGGPLSDESVKKKLSELKDQLAILTAKTSDYNRLRDLLSKLEELKSEKDSVG